jgi:hypothetical protein
MVYESDIEARLVNGAEKLGGVCLKMGQDGWPDRVVALPNGVTVWVELKRPDGRVATLQQWRRKQLRRIGHRVETPKSMEDVERLLEDLRKGT